MYIVAALALCINLDCVSPQDAGRGGRGPIASGHGSPLPPSAESWPAALKCSGTVKRQLGLARQPWRVPTGHPTCTKLVGLVAVAPASAGLPGLFSGQLDGPDGLSEAGSHRLLWRHGGRWRRGRQVQGRRHRRVRRRVVCVVPGRFIEPSVCEEGRACLIDNGRGGCVGGFRGCGRSQVTLGVLGSPLPLKDLFLLVGLDRHAAQAV